MPRDRARDLLRILAPTVAFALVLVLGVGVGYQLAGRRAQRLVADHGRVTTLGQHLELLDPEKFARAYHDPDEALAHFHEYAWVVPQVPTPGVSSAPAPGRHANATINAQQFRHRGIVSVPKPPGRIRIFLTGGSTAFGTGAPDDDRTISAYLERELRAQLARDVEVVNAANAAWASTHERSWIVDRLADLEPDLIVSLSGNNDVHWAVQGRNVLFMRTYADQHYFDLLSDLYRRAGEPLPDAVPAPGERPAPELVGSRLARNAGLVSQFLAGREVPYLFALQPMLAVTKKELTSKERWQRGLIDERFGPGATDYFVASYAAIRTAVAGIGTRGLAVADLTDVFDGAPRQQEIFLDSYHFGDRGNEIIARRLAREVAAVLSSRTF